MGLANQFGEQGAYKCTNCGHSVALYSPSCPRCLDKTLVRIEKTPEKYKPVRENEPSRETDTQQGNPLALIAVLAIVMAIALAVSKSFISTTPNLEPMKTTQPAVSDVSAPASRPGSSNTVRVSNQSSKHSKNTRPLTKITRDSTSGSAPNSASARPAARPMKLWENSSEDEGEK